MQDWQAAKQRTARLSVLSNITLVCFKLAVGLYTGAVSIISEAMHSGVDLLAAVIAFLAVREANKPPDEQHAYGHGKIETLSGAVEALLIVAAALGIVYEAWEKLRTAYQPVYLEYGIGVMLLSAVVNSVVSLRLMRVARATDSQALAADALHLKTDVWTSAGVVAGLILIKITGWAMLDPLIAIAVALLVFRAGYTLTRESLQELTDVSLPPEEETIIRDIVASYPEVITFHRLRTRRSGSWRLIDIHIVVDKHMHLDKAHAVCDRIEAAIEQRLGRCDVVIHLEPCNYNEEIGACPLPPQD